jgi:parallel beta-helix repeat protein
MLPSSRGQLRPREGAGQLPSLLLEKDSLPAGHQGREEEQDLRQAKQQTMHRLVLLVLLAGIMLCCLGDLLSLPLTAPDVSDVLGLPSALAGANVGHVDRGAKASAPLPNGSYPLTPADEVQETDRHPVNSYLLTMPDNNDVDGIFVAAGSHNTRIVDNRAEFNGGDDGIDVNSSATTITSNTANKNGDLGIEAVPGVTDGGGNVASDNGDPRQCVNVDCN